MKFLRLIQRNLWRNRRRTLLTTLAIAVSLLIFSSLMSVPAVFNRFLNDRQATQRLLVHSKAGIFYPLPAAFRERIRATKHVTNVAAFTLFAGVDRDPSELFPNFGADPEEIDQMWPDWGISADEARAFKSNRMAALAGDALMDRFKWKIGDRITLRGIIHPVSVELEIVGTLGDRAPPVALIFRRDYLQEALGINDVVSLYWVKVDRAESIPQVISSLDEGFRNSAAETQTESEAAFFNTAASNYHALLDMAKVLAVIVVISIGLVAANTAAMSIRERQSEIAVLRAIGFPRGTILASLVAEGLVMGVVGGALGCFVGWLLLKFVALKSTALGPLALAMGVPPTIIGAGLAIAALLGMLSALIPAVGATRRNISDGLRAVA
ncbi:MAG: ABC transporter permease [Candidatus Binataceae bacterium]